MRRDDPPEPLADRRASRALRRWRSRVTLFFVVAFLAMIWPVFPYFSRVRPIVLGMPFSLVWVSGWLVASFLALAGLYLWEERLKHRQDDVGGRESDDGAERTPSAEPPR